MPAAKPPTKQALQDAAEDLAVTLRELLDTLPPLDYATAPPQLIEAVHGANDLLKTHWRLLQD